MAERKAVACLFLDLLDDDENRRRVPTRNSIKRREEESIYSNICSPLICDQSMYFI